MTSSKRQRLSKEDEIPETEEYEVFLSFRGPDTRQGFTAVLYDCMDRAGIRVFRDDDELAIGDSIYKILAALNNSQICVPIFSKTFAQSKWCLDEVSEMVERNKDVVPVFYDVTPNDVALKTPAYGEFMAEQENRHDKNTVKKWVAALKAVTKLKGREVLKTAYPEFCESFVEELLIKLKPRKRYYLNNLVGMDNHVDTTMKLLDINGAGGVRYILIHGMGGIGKTTLAKVIFDKLSSSFHGCSFMENLRESSRRDGLDNLQKKLGDSLDPKPSASSTMSRDIRERFRGKKVLIILDDVDAGEQVEELVGKFSFASGSRIIITTRNAKVLKHCKDLDEDSVRSLEMGTLQDKEALELFKLHAFGKGSPPLIDGSLPKEAVSTTGGLPLAIEVIASLLREKRKEKDWRDVIDCSRKIPFEKVQDRLKISYEALNDYQKQIFLDIACFFIGEKTTNATYMWGACQLYYPHSHLEVLVSMSLVKITDEDVIWMHDQLRDLGRDIVLKESIKDPMKRSRIWLPEDAVKVLEGKGRKKKVEALSLRQHKLPFIKREQRKMSLTRDQCAGFRNLRFLELDGLQLEGDCEDLWTELKWLLWRWCPSDFKVSHSFSKNLVILDLSYSSIDENCGGWGLLIQTAVHLKVLDLTGCKNLTRTPDFSRNCSLERLILSDCSNLAEIGISIGNLRRLKFLDLTGCDSLRGFPEEIRLLEDLEEMHVSGNGRQTFSFPNSIGNLKSLLTLRLERLRIDSIPTSIGELARLKHLEISNCSKALEGSKKKVLPESLGNLRSLVKLDLTYWVVKLPASIGGLLQLKELNVRGCRGIDKVSDSLQCLKSLVRLDLSYTDIRNIPDSIGDLQELQVLSLSGCRKITRFPESIGRLNKLVELVLLHTCIQTLPSTINQLALLEKLDLRGCWKLQQLPELPPSLRELGLSGSRITSLPSTVNQLALLEELDLSGCLQLQQLPELLPPSLREMRLWDSRITSLPSTINQLALLEKLDLRGCRKLQQLPELPPSLRELTLAGSRITSLPSTINQLALLEKLDLDGCGKLRQLPELPPSLRELRLSWLGITSLPSTVNQLALLEELDLRGCGDLQQLLALPPSLRKLTLAGSGITSLPSTINQLARLEELDLTGCGKLQQLPELPPSLRKLILPGSSITSQPSTINQLALLEELDLEGCWKLKQLPELPPSLATLSISTVRYLQQLPELPPSLAKSLTRLSITDCWSLPDLSHLRALTKLIVRECRKITRISGIEELESLFYLEISECDSLERLGDLSKLNKLYRLYLRDCPALTCIEGIEEEEEGFFLEDLTIVRCGSLQNVDALLRRSKSGDHDGRRYKNYI